MSDKIVNFPPRGGGPEGSGPDDPTTAQRVTRLEDQFDRIERRLDQIADSLQRVALEVAELKGRFSGLEGRIGALPTTLQLLGLFLAVLVASGLLQWFGPRLAQMASPPAVVSAPAR
jgi:tetrahydromethanopterin S-methyltransferase subunit G